MGSDLGDARLFFTSIERECTNYRLRRITYNEPSTGDAIAWFENRLKKTKIFIQAEPQRVVLHQGFFFAFKRVAAWEGPRLERAKIDLIELISAF